MRGRSVRSVTVASLVSLGALGACGGAARPADAPMAGSASVVPSPASAEVVPKSAPSAPSTTPTGGQHDFVMPATMPTECPCKAKSN